MEKRRGERGGSLNLQHRNETALQNYKTRKMYIYPWKFMGWSYIQMDRGLNFEMRKVWSSSLWRHNGCAMVFTVIFYIQNCTMDIHNIQKTNSSKLNYNFDTYANKNLTGPFNM